MNTNPNYRGRRPLVLLAVAALLGSALACNLPPARSAATPAPTISSPATPTPPPPTSPAPTATPTATASAEREEPPRNVAIARSEGSGTFATASLTNVSLQAGHRYVLQVTSGAGGMRFHGQYSTSAVGADGMPGIQVELLDGTTPASYPIVPPATPPKRWVCSASVQNRGSGGIIIAILDVTEGSE